MSQEIVNESDYINFTGLTILRMIALQPCRMCWKRITGEYSRHWFRAGVFHSVKRNRENLFPVAAPDYFDVFSLMSA